MPKGKHTYRITAPHHIPEEGSFEIVSERPTALNVGLQPTYGFVSVSSNVEKTEIEINGRPVGWAPYISTTDTIDVGACKVEAYRKWYAPQEKTVEIRPLETTNVPFELRKQRPNLFLLAQAGSAFGDSKQFSYGLTVALCRKYGGYLSMRTNGDPLFSTNEMENPYGLYTGQVKKHHFSATGGFMAYVCGYLYAYAGLGVTHRYVDWETDPVVSGGKGQYQTTLNHSGLTYDFGFIGRYKRLAFSAGITITGTEQDTSYKELTVGVGYVFGR